MPNPFQQRASEYQRSDTEFLATLTPELFRIALNNSGDSEDLLTTTTVFSAPPGTGKTTMARFFQYTTLQRVLELVRRESDPAYRELQDFATERGFVRDGRVTICGARVSLERDYRELSMLGYSQERANDLMISLLGARAVLVWRQMFEESGIPADRVRVRPTPLGAARLDRMGGDSLQALAQRAAQVEAVLFGATARFIPPTEQALLDELGEGFFPFLAIESFEIEDQHEPLTPLLMIDDAHWIDASQHQELMTHLTLREVSIARWVFQRMEALDLKETLLWGAGVPSTAMAKRKRDFVDIRLTQALYEQRGAARKNFRRAAEEVSSRYMSQLPDLARHGVRTLSNLIQKVEPTPQQMAAIVDLPEKTARELGISRMQLEQIRERVYAYLAKKPELRLDVLAPAMMSILLHRQFNRQPQRPLFGGDEHMEEPVVVEPDADVAAGAQVQLWLRHRIPFMSGFKTLADLGTENVETFLQLAWQLVRLLETQAVRGRRPDDLSVKQQHDALMREARHIVNSWSFPHAMNVRKLADAIADTCEKKSLEPTAPLGGGANAIGVEQSEFVNIIHHPRLREALFYGMAYSAFTLIPGRRAKNKVWSLIELGGPVIASRGLTTRRGGFVEMSLQDVVDLLEESPA